jgi:hypothetical protein
MSSYKSAVDALASALGTVASANADVIAQFATLGGSPGGSPPIINGQILPDLSYKPMDGTYYASWLQRVADAQTLLNS